MAAELAEAGSVAAGSTLPSQSEQYRAVSKGVIREGPGKQSPKCGELSVGEEITVLDTRTVEGTVRVQFERGWVSVTAASGKVLLEPISS